MGTRVGRLAWIGSQHDADTTSVSIDTPFDSSPTGRRRPPRGMGGRLAHDSCEGTAYWFFTGGVILIGRAVSDAKPSDPGFYRKVLRDAIRFTILIEFLVNLYVFPFAVELTPRRRNARACVDAGHRRKRRDVRRRP
jgi:hypothetical protein